MKRKLIEKKENVTYAEIQQLFHSFYTKFRELCISTLKDERTSLVIPKPNESIPNQEAIKKIIASFEEEKRMREGDIEFENFLKELKNILGVLEEKIRQYQNNRSCMMKEDAERSTFRIITDLQAVMRSYRDFISDEDNNQETKNWVTQCYNMYINQSKIMNTIIVRRNINNRNAGTDRCQNDILSVTRELNRLWNEHRINRNQNHNNLITRTREVQLELVYINVDNLTLNLRGNET